MDDTSTISIISRRYFGQERGGVIKAFSRFNELLSPFDRFSYAAFRAYCDGSRRPSVWPLKHIVDTAPVDDPLAGWARECLQVLRPQVWGAWSKDEQAPHG